jgi:competence protein ComEA
MPSLTRHQDRQAARVVAQRRLALLADEIAATGRGGDVAADTSPLQPPEAASGPGVPTRGRHRAEPLAPGRRVGAAVGDRLPAGVRLRAEGGVQGQHVVVLALLAAALVAAGAWWVLTGRPGEPTVVAPVVSGGQDSVATAPDAAPGAVPEVAPDVAPDVTPDVAAPSTAGGGGDAGTAGAEDAQGEVVVDVTGRVRSPGLVTLPAGSRVADAVAAAGGLRPGTDRTGLNLARPLVDGEQVLVGVRSAPWPQPPEPSQATSGGVPAAAPVDVNTATLEQLDVLPGIGPVTAQAILDWRSAHGAFTSVDELLEVDGIGEVTLADIRDLVTV